MTNLSDGWRGGYALEIEELFYTYKNDVYRYLLSLTHSPDSAEDLLSETFLQALQGLGNFRNQSSVKTWLFGIARNLWLQSLRMKRETLEFSDLLGLYVRDEALHGAVDAGALAARVQELLLQKSEKIRQVMQLRIEGYAQPEVAARCGISENSVRVIEFRAKSWLRENLQKEGLL